MFWDAFHIVNRGELAERFFVDERKQGGGIRLTDNIRMLSEKPTAQSMQYEVESRWRLVETAWSMEISPALLRVGYDNQLEQFFVVEDRGPRIDVTSSRDALNGYQKGKCFYCFRDMVLGNQAHLGIDVDHFLPLLLAKNDSKLGLTLNGVWNLVLACRSCNRGRRRKGSTDSAQRLSGQTPETQ